MCCARDVTDLILADGSPKGSSSNARHTPYVGDFGRRRRHRCTPCSVREVLQGLRVGHHSVDHHHHLRRRDSRRLSASGWEILRAHPPTRHCASCVLPMDRYQKPLDATSLSSPKTLQSSHRRPAVSKTPLVKKQSIGSSVLINQPVSSTQHKTTACTATSSHKTNPTADDFELVEHGESKRISSSSPARAPRPPTASSRQTRTL
jgi:hypothetical protein